MSTIFFGKDARIAKAQNQARTKIGEVKSQVINSFKNNGMIRIETELNVKRNNIIGKAKTAIKDLKTIKSSVETIKTRLHNIVI